eukprot:s1797_g10.t1
MKKEGTVDWQRSSTHHGSPNKPKIFALQRSSSWTPLVLTYQASAAQRRRDRQMQRIRDIQVAQNVIQHVVICSNGAIAEKNGHANLMQLVSWYTSALYRHSRKSLFVFFAGLVLQAKDGAD